MFTCLRVNFLSGFWNCCQGKESAREAYEYNALNDDSGRSEDPYALQRKIMQRIDKDNYVLARAPKKGLQTEPVAVSTQDRSRRTLRSFIGSEPHQNDMQSGRPAETRHGPQSRTHDFQENRMHNLFGLSPINEEKSEASLEKLSDESMAGLLDGDNGHVDSTIRSRNSAPLRLMRPASIRPIGEKASRQSSNIVFQADRKGSVKSGRQDETRSLQTMARQTRQSVTMVKRSAVKSWDWLDYRKMALRGKRSAVKEDHRATPPLQREVIDMMNVRRNLQSEQRYGRQDSISSAFGDLSSIKSGGKASSSLRHAEGQRPSFEMHRRGQESEKQAFLSFDSQPSFDPDDECDLSDTDERIVKK